MGKDFEILSLGEEVLLGKSLPLILGYLDIKDILSIMIRLNKRSHSKIQEENYVFFKKLIRMLNITSTFESSDLAIRENIFEVLKRAFSAIKQNELKVILPFAYFTDAGTYANDPKYFLHCIW